MQTIYSIQKKPDNNKYKQNKKTAHKQTKRLSPVHQQLGVPILMHRSLEEGPHPLLPVSPSPVCSSCHALMVLAWQLQVGQQHLPFCLIIESNMKEVVEKKDGSRTLCGDSNQKLSGSPTLVAALGFAHLVRSKTRSYKKCKQTCVCSHDVSGCYNTKHEGIDKC